MYNKGLSLIYMGRVQEGLQDMQEASRDKAIDDHKVIDEAIRDRGEGYMVFSVVCCHDFLNHSVHDCSSLLAFSIAPPRKSWKIQPLEISWENRSESLAAANVGIPIYLAF